MLGEHLRGRDVRGVCYVEREAAAAASLVASMEAGWLHPAPVWSDLATFDGAGWRDRVHCVASGDPCQGNSVAGKRLGVDDERFLADHVLSIVDAVRPDRVFRENVTGNAAQQLDALCGPLERMGYVVAAGIFSSGRTGNSHGRERLIIMADRADGAGWLYAGQGRSDEGTAYAGGAGGKPEMANAYGPADRGEYRPGGVRSASGGAEGTTQGADGQRGRTGSGDDRQDVAGYLADADGFGHGGKSIACDASADALQSGAKLANASGSRSQGRQFDGACRGERLRPDAPRPVAELRGLLPPAVLPGPSDGRWGGILDRWPQLAPALDGAEAESLLRGGFDALAQRVERLRACGNGVDPVVGAYAWLRLGALLGQRRSSGTSPGATLVREAFA
ncbi:DNA cytosine methyltransferase [Sphingomonas paucimobilis]|uniref:DNA cytosine methyltransferase n=1 Tax=Sphingomonas paucimobilis TaxID=13689 RepID=UPI003B9695AC